MVRVEHQFAGRLLVVPLAHLSTFEICGAVPRYRFEISWSVPKYQLDLVVVGYAVAAIGMPWRADGREWRHDLPMLEPPLAHTAERCAILRLAIGIQPRRW